MATTTTTTTAERQAAAAAASHGEEEQAAAAVVASLSTAVSGWKRSERDTVNVVEEEEEETEETEETKERPSKWMRRGEAQKPEPPVPMEVVDIRHVGPPFFHYRDFSTQVDEDPLTPLTPPARVPNFPAKLHAILSRPDLADVVAWMPHGRSWRVLKPREFEVRVIPTYFEHAKFSSFIRQANGWGFRRITQGRDRNSYYHELFLRGLPHLGKQMRRPGVAEKTLSDPDLEPDFYQISQLHPVPAKAPDEDFILLPCTLKDGPKARMPVHYGSLATTTTTTAATTLLPPPPAATAAVAPLVVQPLTTTSAPGITTTRTRTAPPPPPTVSYAAAAAAAATAAATTAATTVDPTTTTTTPKFGMNPRDFESLSSFQQALQGQVTLHQTPTAVAAAAPTDLQAVVPRWSPLFCASLAASRQAAAVHQAAALSFASLPDSYAASQFAAGFAAATALSSSRIRSVLENALQVSTTTNNNNNTTTITRTSVPPPPSQAKHA